MAFFSFTEGTPIAKIIEGDDKKKKTLYLLDKTDKKQCCNDCTIKCSTSKRKCCAKCEGDCDIDEESSSDSDGDFKDLLKKEFKELRTGRFKDITFKYGQVQPLPQFKKDQRENIFISGPEGAGKSTWAANYIQVYRKLQPKSKFFLFSGKGVDKALDKLKPKRVKLDEKLVENPIQVDEFPEFSIVLFDDVETLSDKKVQEAVESLRDALLERGRSRYIYVISITHNPTNHKKTKASLMEASTIVLFPRGGDTYHLKNVLKTYCGLSPLETDQISRMSSRWVACYKRYPKYVLHEKGAFFPE